MHDIKGFDSLSERPETMTAKVKEFESREKILLGGFKTRFAYISSRLFVDI